MTLWRDPRVLSDEWCPPTLVGRDEPLQQLRDLLPVPTHTHPRAALVTWGHRGVGSSTVAHHFVRSVHDVWWNTSSRRPPLLLRADASKERQPSRVVGALFRTLDPEFDARGSSTELLTMLLLRRLRTLARPVVVWIDQAREGTPGFSRFLRPLLDPGSALPEGDRDLPPLVVVISGDFDPTSTFLPGREEDLLYPVRRLRLGALRPEEVLRAIEVRARLAFAMPPEEEALRAVRDLLLTKGWGLGLAGATLHACGARAQARGSARIERVDVAPPPDPVGPRYSARVLDSCILEAMRRTPKLPAGGLTLPELRERLLERCLEEGVGVPTTARLWRHAARLERAGALRREVRMGGMGGTSTRFWLPSLPSSSPPMEPAHPPTSSSPVGPAGPVGPTPHPVASLEARAGRATTDRFSTRRGVPIGGGARPLGYRGIPPLEEELTGRTSLPRGAAPP